MAAAAQTKEERKAAAAQAKEEQKAAEAKAKAEKEFWASPTGQARAAFERGDQVFQATFDVVNTSTYHVLMKTGTWQKNKEGPDRHPECDLRRGLGADHRIVRLPGDRFAESRQVHAKRPVRRRRGEGSRLLPVSPERDDHTERGRDRQQPRLLNGQLRAELRERRAELNGRSPNSEPGRMSGSREAAPCHSAHLPREDHPRGMDDVD